MNNIIKYNYLILFFCCGVLFSGTDGTLRGKITDIDGTALIGAQIYVAELGKGTTADLDGNFIILNFPVGTYEVKVQMIGYQTKILDNVSITMDQTQWLNVSLPEASIEGEVVYVSAEKALVEKGSTSKKITIGKEAIETLPIKDVSQLYDLQSGVVKIESRTQGIPDHADRGLEEVHVRGGRSGEIAYMIDGMYIRNPIYGGIGNGTRLNKFAIREFDWQPGGFNAEYGDAMSAVSNFHTMSGTNSFKYKFQYETSLLGEALGSRYDELRDYNDYNFGMGMPMPFFKKIKLWVSAQKTEQGAYEVYKFDKKTYNHDEYKYFTMNDLFDERQNNPNWNNDKYNITWPWDNLEGYRGFGFDYTTDYFAKLTYDITSQHKVILSYWNVDAHRKNLKTNFLYWDDGQNEIFRDTERLAFEFNHTINERSFYTIRISDFIQEHFTGVRWMDNDSDGLPDWYEYNNAAGASDYSDPYNSDIIPFHLSSGGEITYYDLRDGNGPDEWTSGWYEGASMPGNYNWVVAEPFTDTNQNGLYDGPGSSDVFGGEDDVNGNGQWDGPVLVQAAEFRDGSYWLTPEMYADYEEFWDAKGAYLLYEGLSPWMTMSGYIDELYYYTAGPDSSENYNLWQPLYFYDWVEEKVYGGNDYLYSVSKAETQEVRFDYTSQITDKWRTRIGVDYKTHKLNYFEVKNPWDDETAFRQRFSEQFDDFGVDNQEWLTASCGQPDFGEGNGTWDGPGNYENPCTGQMQWFQGESYDDFNGDDKWNDYVEPEEFSAYFQNTFEVPWMVINAGVRLDAVQYNTKIWSDPNGEYSPYSPHFYFDCGADLNPLGEPMCPGDYYIIDTNLNDEYGNDISVIIQDNQLPFYNSSYDPNQEESLSNPLYDYSSWDPNSGDPHYNIDNISEDMTNNSSWDSGEPTTSNITETNNFSNVIFKNSDWLYKVSPRLGISHVISDGATFTFNYGLYYQTPIYEFIYRNVNKLEDPSQAFEDAGAEGSSIGNATMTAGRTQSYELAFNVQFSRKWAFSAGIWVKDMDQLTTANQYSSGIYEYKVSKNGDFGTAVGFDFTVENRGSLFNTTMQYTYSTAKASSEYDAAAFGALQVDAPQQEFLMPYDRTHDLTLSVYTTKLPWGINGGITAFFQSGSPYTPFFFEGGGSDPKEDLRNKYSKRSPSLITMNLSLSKEIKIRKHTLMLGTNIFNLFDEPYPIDIYPLTGQADDPGLYYTRNVGKLDGRSGAYYDRPWMYSSNREINFFIRIDFD